MNVTRILAGVVCVMLAATIPLGQSGLAGAQTLAAVVNAGDRKIKLAQESQARVDKTVTQTRSIVDEYKTVTKETEGLKLYNELLQKQLDDQNEEMVALTNSIDRVSVIERQIMPVMVDMIEVLEDFINLDVPFLMDERRARVARLRETLERSDVTPASKFRAVTEAYGIENDFGRTIETYKGSLDIEGGGTREVDFLRMGRVVLAYQTTDAELTGVWDKTTGNWTPLTGSAKNQVKQGLRIANKQTAPDLLLLPVPAAEAAQ